MRLEIILAEDICKAYGAVSTPVEVIDFMLQVSGIERWENLNILEPGCGFCDFLKRIYTKYPNNRFTGIEYNLEVYKLITSLYSQFELIYADFILWEPREKYDLVIGNPPYGIIGDKSHYPIYVMKEKKALYKKNCETWFGKYNIYGAFIEKGIRVLKDRGKLVFIVPATFMILDEFKKLRKFLATLGKVKIYYLGPKIFKGRNVSTCVLVVEKGLKGLELYEVKELKHIKKYYEKDIYNGEIIRFETPETLNFEKDGIPLGSIFSFHFAARSTEIERLPFVSKEPKKGFVPVLTGRNLHPNWIDYESCYSGLWMPKKYAPLLRFFYGFPHLVVGHTKGGKVVAAVDYQCYPWREEIHLVPKVQGININKVANYLNSEEVQEYMKQLYKEITPHITITQLKILPLRRKEYGCFTKLTLIPTIS